jgi:glutathione peroxidase
VLDPYAIQLTMLDGRRTTLGEYAGRTLLIVNVASRCGLTPQYAGLEELARTYVDAGLTVLGAPCNQFMGQEPGTNEEIGAFCSATYGVTFPLTDKLEVNGPGRHPLFAWLCAVRGADGHSGDVRWNFEKWLVDPDGVARARFAPKTPPNDPAILAALTAQVGSRG